MRLRWAKVGMLGKVDKPDMVGNLLFFKFSSFAQCSITIVATDTVIAGITVSTISTRLVTQGCLSTHVCSSWNSHDMTDDGPSRGPQTLLFP